MAQVEPSLDELKARMTEEQRRDMAELISNEVKRRAGQKSAGQSPTMRSTVKPASKSSVKNSALSTNLDHQAMGELYAGMEDKIRALRLKKVEEKENKLRRMLGQNRRPMGLGGRLAFLRGGVRKNALLMCAVAALAIMKVVVDSGVVDASIRGKDTPDAMGMLAAAPAQSGQLLNGATAGGPSAAADSANTSSGAGVAPVGLSASSNATFSGAERQVLTELDSRRVELEKRKQALDQRELDLKNQAQVINERIAELRTLSTKIITVRKERDSQYESRLEQLANVYGSMAPNEAAPLVAKLENDTAIALLRRMPGKRMGQILSLMEQERAVSLTKILSNKENLDDLPAK